MIHTTGPVHMFHFEPGDGTWYRVLFGRLPPTNHLFEGYVLFGLAEGNDAMITVVFDTDQINAHTFSQHWGTATFTHAGGDLDYLESTAYAVFAALVGRPGVEPPAGWREDWRTQLPAAALG